MRIAITIGCLLCAGALLAVPLCLYKVPPNPLWGVPVALMIMGGFALGIAVLTWCGAYHD